MASIRQSIRSSTASKRPTSAIADGQIALNTASGTPGMFFKDSAGNIIKAGPAHYGASAPNSSPAVGGSTGNSIGEAWLDSSLTPAGWKIWNGSAFVNATPLSSDTVQGLVELATNVETQAGVDTARAVTSASLQSKVSDSISTASASGIASSTAVKTAYDLANAALPKSGGIITGNLEIGTTGSFTFEGSTADGFETTLAVVDPTLDRTITFPNITGTVVTTGDTGTVTSTMILDGTILNADVNASAAIAGTKISPDFGSQNTTTTGTSTAASFIPTSSSVPTNGVYLPAANSVAISTNGTGRLFVDASGNIGVGTANPVTQFHIQKATGGLAGVQISTSTHGSTLTDGLFVGIDNSLGYLYQYENLPLAFGTNSAERLRITSTGALNFVGAGTAGSTQAVSFNGSAPVNSLVIDSSGRLGIGTSGPLAKTEISLTGISSGKTDAANWGANGIVQLFNSDGATSDSEVLLLGAQSGGLGQLASGFGFGRGTSGWGTYLNFYTHSDSTANIDELTERMRITSGGNVGIGTTSVNAPLHVSNGGAAGLEFYPATYEIQAYNRSTSAYGLARYNAAGHQFAVSASEVARIDSSGRLLVGGSPDSGGALLQVFGDRIRVGTAKTPASASATGAAGEICWDASYIYVCTATNTWKRTAIATW